MSKPDPWWWFSFADRTRPERSAFLGVVVVQAANHVAALTRIHALGCHPGGEAVFDEMPRDLTPPDSFTGRLLSRSGAAKLAIALNTATGSSYRLVECEPTTRKILHSTIH